MPRVKILLNFVLALTFVSASFIFTNTQMAIAQDTCLLSITKVANPADDTPFNFIATGDDDFEFVISDPSDPTSSGFIADGNTITITEELPPGWELDGIECVQGVTNCGVGEFVPCLEIIINEETNSITATCLDDDEGACTFTNVRVSTTVPTLSQWGLIALAVIVGIAGFMVIRKRKVTA